MLATYRPPIIHTTYGPGGQLTSWVHSEHHPDQASPVGTLLVLGLVIRELCRTQRSESPVTPIDLVPHKMQVDDRL